MRDASRQNFRVIRFLEVIVALNLKVGSARRSMIVKSETSVRGGHLRRSYFGSARSE